MPTSEQSAATANRQIARAAGATMAAFVIANVAGLLAKILTAQAFDGAQLDAFFAANRLVEIIFTLVAGGALGSAFIPTFVTFLEKKDRLGAWKLASAVLNLVELVLVLLSILAAIFAPQVVRHILAPGFTDPAQQAETVRLLRIMLPSAAIFGLSGLAMGVLNAYQIFLIPTLAPAFYQVGWILGVLFLAPVFGIDGLAWGTVVGSLLHLLLQLPSLIKLPGRQYFLSLGLHIPAVRDVGRLMAPRLLGVAVLQLNFLINTNLASYNTASLMAISFGFSIMLMPEQVIAQAIAVAALPTFSAQIAHGRLEEMRASLANTLRGVLLLALPAAFGLILLRQPLVQLLYERGQFTTTSTEMVSWALLWYTTGLVGHSMVEITSRAFYALHDTRTPVFLLVVSMSLNILFSLAFTRVFASVGWMPHGGLALANSLATTIEAAGLLILMRKRLSGLEGSKIARAAGLAVFGSLVMGFSLWAWLNLASSLPSWLIAVGGVIIGGLVYLLVMASLRVPEISLVWSKIKARL